MQHYLLDPTTLQLEISSMCNALCPGCNRTDPHNFNQKRSTIPDKTMIKPDTFRKLLADPGFASISKLEFCGSIDEPFMHPQFNELLGIASMQSNIDHIVIHTNGAIRLPEYWTETASILSRFHKHEIKFSIDGLSDTNHMYRQNTRFDAIMENAKSFIDAGGKATWQFLVFPWNNHQIDDACQKSKDMGFWRFVARNDRSTISQNNWTYDDIAAIKMKNHQGNNNSSSSPIRTMFDANRDIEDEPIDCYFGSEGMYFIDFESRLWPCCFIRNTEFNKTSHTWRQIDHIMFADDPDWNRLDIHSVSDVLAHDFYTKHIVSSFSQSFGTGKCGKMVKCATTCGKTAKAKRPLGQHKITLHREM